MPKSKNSKSQKSRSQARSAKIKHQQIKFRKELMEKYKKIQEEQMLKTQGDNTEVKEGENIVETDDFGLEEMELTEEEVKEEK